jgi:GT2 family glycosyltransferase
MLSVVIPVYNPLHLESKIDQFLIPQLKSFVRNTSLDNVEYIYVINGSTEKTFAAISAFDKTLPVKMLWFDEGLGFTRATNLGIMASHGDTVLLLNDDAIILDYCAKDEWVNWLLAPFREDILVGITGPHQLWCNHSQANFIVGYCMALRRNMLLEIGLLDEIFSPGAGEDTDLCIRARLHDWKCIPVPARAECTYPIYHPGESTFHHWEAKNDYAPGSKWDVVFNRNSDLLRQRRLRGYYSTKQPIVPTIPRLPA